MAHADVPGRVPVAIGSHAYMAEARGLDRTTVQVIRQQSDTSTEPGEQSLSPLGLWRRSQESWHHGAGQDFLDGRDEKAADPHRFRYSWGVDPWTRGQVSLLHPTIKSWATASTNLHLAVAQHSSASYLYVADGTEVYHGLVPFGGLNTLALQTGTGWTPTNATIAPASTTQFTLTATSAAAVSATSPTGTSGVPVEEGREYLIDFASVYVSGGAGKFPAIRANWYDGAGALLSSSTVQTGSFDDDPASSVSHTVTAPAGAAFASLTISYSTNLANGEVHRVISAQIAPEALTAAVVATSWSTAAINAGQATQTVQSLVSNGTYVWAALGTSGLHRTLSGATTSTADVPAAPGAGQIHLVGYANGFLLAAGSTSSTTGKNTLWRVDSPLGSPALVVIKTHDNPSFEWTGIGPGRNCAPGDQLVTTTNRGPVRIDELDPATDRLASFDPHSGRVLHGRHGQGYAFQRAVRPFSGDLVVMTTDETRARFTPDHRVMARWAPEASSAHCVYLMRRGDWWRVGKSNLLHCGRFGPGGRARTEKADAVWVLGVYPTAEEALLAEEYFSARYGVTQAVFTFGQHGARRPRITDEMLKNLHEQLAREGSGERARRLLSDMGLELDHPLWVGQDPEKLGMRTSFKLRACNVISGWMTVPTYTSYTTAKRPWLRVTTTRESVVETPVYSLNVEPYHTYVGDGQCVFNCVYAWGNSGGNGEIYKITLDPNTGTLSTAASFATYLPDGETIHALQFYAGGIIMGTGKGVRLGQADGAGNIDYGPLIETNWSVNCLEPQGRWCWFGWTDNTDAATSCLGRIDLGYLTDTLTPAWATDLLMTEGDQSANTVVSCVTFTPYGFAWDQRPPVRVFTVAGKGVYIEDPSSRVSQGRLATGTVRFNTSEPKTVRSADVRHHALPSGATVALSMIRDSSGDLEVIGTSSTADSYGPAAPFNAGNLDAEAIEFSFVMTRPDHDNGDFSRSPELTRWTAKVLPLPSTIDETFTIPIIMTADSLTNQGDGAPYPIDVPAEIVYLKGLERSRQLIDVQIGDEEIEDCYVIGSEFRPWRWSEGQKYLEGLYVLNVQTARG